ncbi:ABC transporter substrate-binding protein [Rhodococcus sp. HNM0569]|uniref:ABC transporter substrate-binding protein n=1 Tax=Rhodococcus sp. HNM0569 TaxID=2716340 RepID=UPI00146BA0FC|nr:ABC transporter substrate-binding protein [Rhodococcus sp. HNM0569]NLU84374.1 ABC transporter substrate-binding protein [Rhodococcus sp. HNM0569]
MRIRVRRAAAAVGMLTATALVAAACGAGGDRGGDASGGDGAGDTTGVTDDTVTIGGHFPLTGVAAPGYSEIPSGHQAYYDFVNAAGGVHGRQIEWIVEDDGYNPTNTSTVTEKLVLQDQIFAMVAGLGTPPHNAVIDYLNDEQVPDLFVSSGSLQWGDDPEANPWTFGWQTDYESEGKIIGQYVAENMPDAKVGLFLQDDDFGEDGEKGVRQFLNDDQIVSVQRYTSGNTEVGPQIAALQASGADVVLGFTVPSYTALSQLAGMTLGYHPQWFYSNVGSDPALVGGLLARFSEGRVEGASALDGTLTTEYLPGIDQTDNPWIQLFTRVWEEYGNGQPLTNYRLYGMSQAYTFVQTLMAAGEDLTRESVVEALQERGGDFEGPALAPFRYSADSHMGISGMAVSRIEGAGGEYLTPILVTDIGDAPIEPESSGSGEDAPPENGIPEAP